ncbi:MAG: phosphonate ABC transporter ATP-binding protein [Actinomycetota bacterium]|nr:phosphonate ABC transporter ATP-binding protein [Actinomycetota bacterium]
MSPSSSIRVAGLGYTYPGYAVPALAEVSFEVAPGEVVAVLGPSGAGKTTLFRCLTQLVDPDEGTVELAGRRPAELDGRELRLARLEVGLIFQQFNLVRRLTAQGNVLAGRLGHLSTWRVLLRRFPAADRELAGVCLARVGLSDQADQRADRLSGGQQQRVAIARVLAQQSSLVLADEPVASLDPETATSVLDTLRDVARERDITVLSSLHQIDLATRFADRVLGLRAGRLVVDKPAEAFDDTDYGLIFASPTPAPPSGTPA